MPKQTRLRALIFWNIYGSLLTMGIPHSSVTWQVILRETGWKRITQRCLRILRSLVTSELTSSQRGKRKCGTISAIASLSNRNWSENQQKQLLRHLFVAGQPKTKNEKVYYIVDAIHQAINEGRKLSFQCFGYLPDKTKELKHGG